MYSIDISQDPDNSILKLKLEEEEKFVKGKIVPAGVSVRVRIDVVSAFSVSRIAVHVAGRAVSYLLLELLIAGTAV